MIFSRWCRARGTHRSASRTAGRRPRMNVIASAGIPPAKYFNRLQLDRVLHRVRPDTSIVAALRKPGEVDANAECAPLRPTGPDRSVMFVHATGAPERSHSMPSLPSGPMPAGQLSYVHQLRVGRRSELVM